MDLQQWFCTDSAPGFQALCNDDQLHRHNIAIELGWSKNKNKVPIADKAVLELENELLRQEPGGGPVTRLQLTLATARLNSRIRNHGLSAREVWTQRDQFTHEQILISDPELIHFKHQSRLENHPFSEANRQRAPTCPANVGDLVYLYCDANKSRARSRYLVTGRDGEWLIIKKFAGTQLRNTAYRVRLSECYKVPYELPSVSASDTNIELCNGSVEDKPVPTFGTPVPPAELSTPSPLYRTLVWWGNPRETVRVHPWWYQPLPHRQ